METEIWKDIPDYEGWYQVSDLANVKSLERKIIRSDGKLKTFRGRILIPTMSSNGYLMVSLCKNGRKGFKVSVLVAMAFLGHKPDGTNKIVVDHIDNIRTHDYLSNLQLISQRKNITKDRKGSSVYTGVSWNKRANKWRSFIWVNRKSKFLGYFVNEIEASEAYNKALNKLK